MKIIGYTYEADHHCIECAQKRFPALKEHEELRFPFVVDSEGNEVRAVYDTDEWYDLSDDAPEVQSLGCGDCFTQIAEHDTEHVTSSDIELIKGPEVA